MPIKRGKDNRGSTVVVSKLKLLEKEIKTTTSLICGSQSFIESNF